LSAVEELNLARFIAEFRRFALLPPASPDAGLMPTIQCIPLTSSMVAVVTMTVPIIDDAVAVVATVIVVAVMIAMGKVLCSFEGCCGGGCGSLSRNAESEHNG
jgi:hypothetical protein